MIVIQPERMVVLTRGNKTGEIIMTKRDDAFLIGKFLPGVVTIRPNGERVIEPEQMAKCFHQQQADNFFDRYLAEAIAAGWSRP